MLCPVCTAPLLPAATSCPECTVQVTPDAAGHMRPVFPAIRPSEAIAMLDFRSVPLPGALARTNRYDDGSTCEASNDGIVVTLRSDLTYRFEQPYIGIRDGCVRASMVALDPQVELQAFARLHWIDDLNVRYNLAVRPSDRTFGLARLCAGRGSGSVSGRTDLWPLTPHAAIAPPGHPNVLELRVQGPTVQAWINGQWLTTVHDAALGAGQTGLAINTVTKTDPEHAKRALCQWFEVRAVVA